MTYKIGPTRKAMTAIAAVLAFSSTPLLAQETEPVADATVEPVAADPLAPAPEAAPEPVTTEAAPAAVAAPPAPRPKVETARATAPRPTARRAASTARSAAPAPAAAPVAEAPAAPAAPPVAEALPVASAPIAAPAPTDAPTAIEAMIPDELVPDDMIPVAGGAALGLLGIGGIAMAMRRRKRRKEEDELHAAKWAMIEASAEPEPRPALDLKPEQIVEREPAIARTPAPVHDPVAPGSGRHVQAAYRGPTPDNPSVSLEYRLRKATILDQQEQDAAEASGHAAKVPEKTGWAEPNKAEFMLRRANVKPAPKPVIAER